jgi:hypothetical protein
MGASGGGAGEQWSLLKDPEVVEISGKVGRNEYSVTQRAFRVVVGRDTAPSGKSVERSGTGVDAAFPAVSKAVFTLQTGVAGS